MASYELHIMVMVINNTIYLEIFVIDFHVENA